MASLLSSLVDASKRAIPTSGTDASTTTPIPPRSDSGDVGEDWEALGLSPPSKALEKERDDDVVSLDGDGRTSEDALAEQRELEDLRARCKALEVEKETVRRERAEEDKRNSQRVRELEAHNASLSRERSWLAAERDALRDDVERLAADRGVDESRAQDLQNLLDGMRGENEALARAKEELQEETEALECHFTEELSALEARCKSLEKENLTLSETKEELTSAKETVVWLTDQLKTKTQEIEEHNECLRVLGTVVTGPDSCESLPGSSVFSDTTKRLYVELKKKQDEHTSARRRCVAMVTTRDLEARKLNGKVSQLTEELQKRDTELEELKATCASLQEKITVLETSKRELKERLERRKKRHDVVVEKLARYESLGRGEASKLP
ncbi:hypothetical protein CONPUDRAFT_90528 [Coniophora puteana RWD-64-598 SS2]|uniref:Uncharacterized protein n=1 Tax=Coniophora puteana (strain RWD-64-598) TaxID=741705 RepID=A0A5M3MMH0_CONPW|nr:uncharacterized protein CONPUDRAFT_90528 [Coniophora puteana RWD-64-598 SS2]EIW80227.1 hypothetical protein CONPUDRAFT_90528 [Coniophora puteana RWD-64-598 SS2]